MAALDDQIRETVDRLVDSMRSRLESDLGSCRDELIRAAQEDSNRTAEAIDAATAAAHAAEDEKIQLNGEIESLRRQLDEARADARRRLEELQQRFDESERQLEDSQRERVAAREEIGTLKNDLEAAHGELDTTRDDVEATLRDIETLRRDSDAARADVSRLTAVLNEKEERVTQARRLPEAIRTLDEAATFGEVLENLALRAGREAGRAAVFLVKGDRLRDWRTVGFDGASDASRLDIGLSDSALMAEAVRTGEAVHPRGGSGVPAFARSGEARAAAAWPVSVGGSVVAVLYADGAIADTSDEPYWPALLDVLARHAGRVLEGITVRQAAGLMAGKTGVSPVHRQSSGSVQ